MEKKDDLKKDNIQIESLLTLLRSKVKEASVSFMDSYLLHQQNSMDMSPSPNEFENYSEYEEDQSPDQTTELKTVQNYDNLKNFTNENLLIRHKF